jgi:excisionase family DNA binding protein
MIEANEISGSAAILFEPLLDDKQAGKMLGLHPKTLQRLARRGDIPAIRIGRYWRFRASTLDQWIENQQTGGHDAKIM